LNCIAKATKSLGEPKRFLLLCATSVRKQLRTFTPGSLATSLAVCRDKNKYDGSVTRIVRWFCCSAFCTNNFRTRNPQGESIKFYCLPRDPEVQATYTRILQTTCINWHSGRGYRENASADFPDIPAAATQLMTLEKCLNSRKLN